MGFGRRAFVEGLVGVPLAGMALSAQTTSPPVVRFRPRTATGSARVRARRHGPGRILIGFTPAIRIEQFFRDLERRGEYFGNGTPADKDLVHRLYGIVNVGPPLKL